VATETSVATVRSPPSDLLVYPTPTQKISKPKGARVLISAESISFLEEKQCKKQEELGTEAKNAGPKERYAKERITKSNTAGTRFSRNRYLAS